jgi:small-conductance mechanosensitive channel
MGFPDFFNYELIHSTRFSLTVSDIFLIVLLLLLAYLVIYESRKILFKRAEAHRKTASGRYYAYAQLIKYIVYLFTFFILLDILNINLTMIKAGGAALLVGLGFGLQHTFNDFVSGVIILSEGSLQVGNIVEIENIVGRVKQIGIRTSTITTRDGVTIIVPNSKLVSDNVVNWSHQDVDRTRFNIRFNVAIDSDLDKVKNILLTIASENKDVVKNPAPKVRLYDFNESGIVIDLLFWTVNMFFVETVKSDIRFRIVNEFRNADIHFAFPNIKVIHQ